MEFELYGKSVEFDDEHENFNDLAMLIRKEERKVVKNFSERFYARFKNMDAVMNGIEDFVFDYFNPIVDLTLKLLSSNKVYNFDEKKVVDFYCQKGCISIINGSLKLIEDKYLSIIQDQEEAAAYRQARKDSRGRWQGGGFGIDGAIQGALTAGAANMASGMAHSAFNAVGNIASGISASMQKNELYKNPDMVGIYMDGVVGTMEAMLYALMLLMDMETDVVITAPTNEEVSDAKAIVNNIKQGYITGDDLVLEKCVEAIGKDPYNSSIYELMLNMYDDPKGELSAMASHFGIIVVDDFKAGTISKLLSEIDYYSENGLSRGKETLENWAKRFDVDTKVYVSCIDQVGVLLTQYKRKIDNEEYSSVNDAQAANKLLKAIIEKISQTSINDTEAITNIINEMKASDILSKDKYIKYLEKAIEEEDVRFRTIGNVVFDSREAATIARSEYDSIWQQIPEGTIESIEVIDNLLNAVNACENVEVKEYYLAYINYIRDYALSQKDICSNQQIPQFSSRKDFSEFFWKTYPIRYACEKVLLPEFADWYKELEISFRTINGAVVDLEDADKLYFKWVDHAKSYKQYINEKNSTEKKSLFSSLKTGVTGLVYKNYEGEYNSLTNNGTTEIPVVEDDAVDSTQQYKQAATETVKQCTKSITKVDTSILDAKLDANSFYINTNPINADDVKKVFKEYDILFDIKENPEVEQFKRAIVNTVTDENAPTYGKVLDGMLWSPELARKLEDERKELISKGIVRGTFHESYDLTSDNIAYVKIWKTGKNKETVIKIIATYMNCSEKHAELLLMKAKDDDGIGTMVVSKALDLVQDIKFANGDASWHPVQVSESGATEEKKGFNEAESAAIDYIENNFSKGQYIEAVNYYAKETGVGMAQAKDIVDILFLDKE